MKFKYFLLLWVILAFQQNFPNSQFIMAQGFLHTRGEDIVDGAGKKVFLRGLGLGNWMLPEGYMWKFKNGGDRPRKIEKVVTDLLGEENAVQFWKDFRKNYITEADIQRMAELGFNSVRPALNSRLFLTEGESPVFIDEGFLLLDNLVSWCKKYGIYVIIDMHGAPGGQTGANIDDSPDDKPRLFMDARNQDLLVKLWVKIAGRYKDEPTVAAYDLLNEPLPGNTGAAAQYGSQLEPLYKRITAAIREIDKNHMITLEGMDWANNWSVFTAPFDDNVFYQFHYYCWDQPDNLKSIRYYADIRKKFNVPVWIGETGEKNNTIYWGTTQYFEANNMGWSFWPWKKMDTQNTPYSIRQPPNWEQVISYTGAGPKPSAGIAKQAFDELIENIKLTNCVYYPDVVNSTLRQIPVQLQGENYGHKGYNLSYFVKDTTFRAPGYRITEPVPVFAISPDGKEGQYIRLKKHEWTRYEVNSAEEQTVEGIIRARSSDNPVTIVLNLNGSEQKIQLSGYKWQDVRVKGLKFRKGSNVLTMKVLNGVADVDWIKLL